MREVNERDIVLGNLTRAVKMLERSIPFVQLIPEVRTNLIYALPEAKLKEEVAGIEGRITVANEMPKASGFPCFGASSHMARFIIEMRILDQDPFWPVFFSGLKRNGGKR